MILKAQFQFQLKYDYDPEENGQRHPALVPSLLSLATLAPWSTPDMRVPSFAPLLSLSPTHLNPGHIHEALLCFPSSCPSPSLQLVILVLAAQDAGWSGRGRYGARCQSGLAVLTRPWSAPAPLPPVLPSHSSPLPWWCGAPGGVEREDTEQGARVGWWWWW